MSRSRRALCALGLLFAGTAFGGIWTHDNPTVVRPVSRVAGQVIAPRSAVTGGRSPVRGRANPTYRSVPHLFGEIAAIRAIALDGSVVEVEVPAGMDLSEPVPLPETGALFADLEIDLAGPAWVVSAEGRRALGVDTLTVALEDPDAAAEVGAVVLSVGGADRDGVVVIGG